MTVVKMVALQVSSICRPLGLIVVPVFLMVVMFGPREISSQLAYEDPCDPQATYFRQRCADLKTSCIMSRSDPYLCLCAAAFYRHSDGTCREVSELQVFDISVSVSNTTATLAWNVKNLGVNVTYTVQQHPGDGQVEEVSKSGAIVSGLIPERTYSFVITAALQPDMHYGKKSVQANSDIVNIGNRGAPERPIVYVKFRHRYSSKPNECCDIAVQRAQNDVNRRMELQINGDTYTSYHIPKTKILTFGIYSLQPNTEYSYTLTVLSARNKFVLYTKTGTLRTPSSGKLYDEICTTSEECLNFMVCGKETGTCICDEGYYNPYGNRTYCDSRASIGRQCQPYVPNQCQEKSACVFRPVKRFTCQCDRSHYHAGGEGCLPLSRLQVWNISSHVTDNTVTFKWNIFDRKRGDPAIITYGIEWTPADRSSTAAANQFGGQVSGLEPETEYIFTILTTVSDSDSTKRAAVSAGRVCTLSMPKSASMKEMETMSEVALGVAIAVACLTLLALTGLVVLLWRRKSSQFSKLGFKEAQSTDHENPSAPQGRVLNRYQTTPVQQRHRNADHDSAEASREVTDDNPYEVPDTDNSFRISENNTTPGPNYFNVSK